MISRFGETTDDSAREIYNLTIGRIRPFLGDRKQLLISPDGELSIVPFAAFEDENRRYLLSDYTISYLSSGRELTCRSSRI
jgi:CHAT domain-containing protein